MGLDSFFTGLDVFLLFLYVSSLCPFVSLREDCSSTSLIWALKELRSHLGLAGGDPCRDVARSLMVMDLQAQNLRGPG